MKQIELFEKRVSEIRPSFLRSSLTAHRYVNIHIYIYIKPKIVNTSMYAIHLQSKGKLSEKTKPRIRD